jgi:uroporphyrinogen III methyltransferase / synthase
MTGNELKSLRGCSILVTRTAEQSVEFTDRIRELGGNPVCIPMIAITDPDTWDDCDRAIINLRKYDGVIFTSTNAVRGFMNRMEREFPHATEIFKRRSIYAVGEKTREELAKFGIRTDGIPDEFTAESLVDMILQSGAEGRSYLLPAGNLTRDIVENGLTGAGAIVDRVAVYATKKPDDIDTVRLRRLVETRSIDIITFFSPSGADHFFELLDPSMIRSIPVAVIGKTTYNAVMEHGIQPRIQSDEATADGLIKSILMYRNS